MDVSENSGTPKSSILIGFSIINHPVLGVPLFLETLISINIRIYIYISQMLHVWSIYPQNWVVLGLSLSVGNIPYSGHLGMRLYMYIECN